MMCYRLSFMLALSGLFLGCSETGGPSVNYVEGLVTLDGQPIEGVIVGFNPVGDKGIPATGTTDANGVFKLTSSQNGKPDAGAATGEYQVTFMKYSSGQGSSEIIDEDDPNYGKQEQTRAPPQMEYIVPEKYMNPATSEFKVSVKPGTNKGDDFKFDLKKE